MNAILDVMIMALGRGRDVEFPFGRLSRVRTQFGARWGNHDDRPAHRDPYSVQWIPSWEGLKQLLGPEAAEQEAVEYMFDLSFLRPICRSKAGEKGWLVSNSACSGKLVKSWGVEPARPYTMARDLSPF